ncbi:MAG: hypothetical protein CVV34_06260 [Methanomicrobiales archaeon HGW-Methanomicrobiales-5]|nr:MAG: hypothetical protein CVV34_06260 [Methanomicrobiales archaeon HGW-Methanomicrobiales-5]
MTSLDSIYRKEHGQVLVEIKVSSPVQLFNTFDPAPFYERELNPDAVQYIVDAVRDFSLKTPIRLIVYLPADIAGTLDAQKIPEAISNHFRYLVMVQERKFRQKWIYGKFTILVGISFLIIAMSAGRIITASFQDSTFAQLIATTLDVAGWVAMWEPITVHLYQLWPIVKHKKIFEKISRMEIEVRPYS